VSPIKLPAGPAAGFPYLAGEASKNLEDASSRFPRALQGVVLGSRGELESWTSPIMRVEAEEDWCALTAWRIGDRWSQSRPQIRNQKKGFTVR
jgi:hypothetical protein